MKPANNELIKFLGKEDEAFQVESVPIVFEHKVDIDEEFVSTKQFTNLVAALQGANEGDMFNIRLTTPGGSLPSILPLLEAMNATDGHVHIDVISDVASAGTFLMMLADSVHINPYCTIMFHNASYGVGGHAGNVQALVKHYEKMLDSMTAEMYTDFLTEEEIGHLNDGLEIYLNPQDCYERFAKRNDIRKAKNEEAMQRVVDAQQKRPARRKKPAPPVAQEDN